jgi:hypothetical protein
MTKARARWRIEVFCVRCGETNGHPAVVEEARRYHQGEGFMLEGDAHQIWTMCRRCVELLERGGAV